MNPIAKISYMVQCTIKKSYSKEAIYLSSSLQKPDTEADFMYTICARLLSILKRYVYGWAINMYRT